MTKKPGGLPHTYGWLRRPECETNLLVHVYETPDGLLVEVPRDLPPSRIVPASLSCIASLKEKDSCQKPK